MPTDPAANASDVVVRLDDIRGVRLADRSDDDLLLLARGGLEEAFDEIVRRYQRPLARTAHRYVGDLHATEDVVQDTLMDMYRHLPRYRPNGRFRALVYRSLLNRARMARRTWRRARLDVGTEPPDVAVPAAAENQVLRRERQREIQRAVDTLPDRYRRVVALRYGAELEYAEIAEVLDIPIGTVKSRMFTAFRKMEKKLEDVRW